MRGGARPGAGRPRGALSGTDPATRTVTVFCKVTEHVAAAIARTAARAGTKPSRLIGLQLSRLYACRCDDCRDAIAKLEELVDRG